MMDDFGAANDEWIRYFHEQGMIMSKYMMLAERRYIFLLICGYWVEVFLKGFLCSLKVTAFMKREYT